MDEPLEKSMEESQLIFLPESNLLLPEKFQEDFSKEISEISLGMLSGILSKIAPRIPPGFPPGIPLGSSRNVLPGIPALVTFSRNPLGTRNV